MHSSANSEPPKQPPFPTSGQPTCSQPRTPALEAGARSTTLCLQPHQPPAPAPPPALSPPAQPPTAPPEHIAGPTTIRHRGPPVAHRPSKRGTLREHLTAPPWHATRRPCAGHYSPLTTSTCSASSGNEHSCSQRALPSSVAMHFSLEQILAAQTPLETTRAWTLWMLLPRMILQRPPGTRTLPKDEWRRRIFALQRGEWHQLLATQARPLTHPEADHPARHQNPPSPERRAERARHLVHQSELSAARQALTATPPAPGTAATLAPRRGPALCPRKPLAPPSRTVTHRFAAFQKRRSSWPVRPHSRHIAFGLGQ